MRIILFSVISLAIAMCTNKDQSTIDRTYSKEVFKSPSSFILPYRLLQPDKIEKGEHYPLVIFLHGSGERGTDNELQLKHIAPYFLEDSFMEKYPSYVIFPQCPENSRWSKTIVNNGQWYVGESMGPEPAGQAVLELIDQFIRENPVDRRHIYIAGLSMGGFGTLDLVRHRPEFFAAAVSICGGGNKRYTHVYEDLPIWLFHGTKDPVVPVHLSKEMAEEYAARYMEYRYTEFPEGGHDIWNEAWQTPELIPWLFSKERITKQ